MYSEFATDSQYPNNLTPAEYHELAQASAIHPGIIERNFLHIEGSAVYNYLFISNSIPRKNAGRVTDGFLKRYSNAQKGGLWISGLDPQNNWEPMEWGRFKPTNPRIDEDGKPIKYESPPKTTNRVTYFDVPEPIWSLVSKRYKIKRYYSLLALRLQDKLGLCLFLEWTAFEGRLFWEWVQRHPEIPIILCEGEKKAACLLSLGFVAIALPGIWNGRVTNKKDFDEHLHPDLMPMAQPGRKFIILFDYETKPKTQWSVFQATLRTGKVIEATSCTCEVALLPGPEKGVDDFVVERGEKAEAEITAIIDDAKSLSDYQSWFFRSFQGLIKYKPDLVINVKYLSQAFEIQNPKGYNISSLSLTDNRLDVEDESTALSSRTEGDTASTYDTGMPTTLPPGLLPESGLAVLWSVMGTGKTELLKQWRDQNPDKRFLNNGHRVNLLKNLSQRLSAQMYSEMSYGELARAKALSITIDSLYKLNTDFLKYDCVFIDEASQYLVHLLHSKTCKEHRAEILEVLEYIVYNAKLVVIADAHIDDVTIDFFLAMRPKGERPYIIKNQWKNGGRPIFWYEGNDSSAIVAQIAARLMMGEKVMVVADSKRFIKKLEYLLSFQIKVDENNEGNSNNREQGTGNREQGKNGDFDSNSSNQLIEDSELNLKEELTVPSSLLPVPSSLFPSSLRVWSIHSDNSGSEENVVFIKDISNAVKSVDALLTSPSLGTGVDIAEYHFDAVFGVFHAVSQTATECVQQLYRYRPQVPIHVWVAERCPFGYKDTNPTKIKERILSSNSMTAFLLRIDRETGKRGAEKDWALDAYCQIEAQRNQSINNLRDDLRNLLVDMGNYIIPMGASSDSVSSYQLKNAAAILDAAYYKSVAEANNISSSEYRQRQSKDYLKPEAVFECEKFRILDAYGTPVNPELVEKDNGGRLISALAALEMVLEKSEGTIMDEKTGLSYPTPPAIVTEKDRDERLYLPLCMDWRNYSAQWVARYTLGLPTILQRLVNGGEITASDPHLIHMTEIAIQCAAHVKTILGFTIPSKCKPMWLLAKLVEQLGLKLANCKRGSRGQQVRFYFLRKQELDFALQVIAHRQNKRILKEERKRQVAEAHEFNVYGIESPEQCVSNPPPSCIGKPPMEDVDTKVENIDFADFEPEDGLATPIKLCVEQLRGAIKYGVEAVKTVLGQWTSIRRWCVVSVLEKFASDELLQLEQLAPQFYEWLA